MIEFMFSKMVLRSKPPVEKIGEKENVLKPIKTSKTKSKKKGVSVAGKKMLEKNKPKKPPTAFFYFLCAPSLSYSFIFYYSS